MVTIMRHAKTNMYEMDKNESEKHLKFFSVEILIQSPILLFIQCNVKFW